MNCNVSYEELAAFAAHDMAQGNLDGLRRHIETCEACRNRLAALEKVDGLLHAMVREEPPARAVLNAWRAVLDETRDSRGDEIMTIEEVASFLKVPLDDLDLIVSEIPSFELAGHLRVRRVKLFEWIEDRERRHRRGIAESEVARGLAGILRTWPTTMGRG